MKQKESFSNFTDFLHDDDFIAWQLFHTQEQNDYWDKLITDNPDCYDALKEACLYFASLKLNDTSFSEENRQLLYQQITTHIHYHNKNTKKIRVFSAIGAAVILLMIAFIIPFYIHNNQQISGLQTIKGYKNTTSEDVQLISNGKTILLTSNASITLAENGQASITDSVHTKKYQQLSNGKPNKLIVPYGKRSFITLEDGTKIWLNSGTQLSFPSSFAASTTRDIHVEGEIYLEVAKHAKPFIVNTAHSKIEVLGTAFNVSAYSDDVTEQVLLVHGSINLKLNSKSSVKLHPNELATIRPNKCEIDENVDITPYTSWIKGSLVFSEAPMSEILKKLTRYYNVSFTLPSRSALKTKTVSGKLFLSNNIDSVMTTISLISSVDYKRDGNKITFLEKKKQ